MTSYSNVFSAVLTGGSTNTNADLSLGGSPSSSVITSGLLNNLFSDISTSQDESGYIDYRCIYIWNDGDETFGDISLWTVEEADVGASVLLGIISQDEIQRITFSTMPTGGGLILKYNGEEVDCGYDTDLDTWVTKIANNLNALSDLDEVAINIGEQYLDVVFGGALGGGLDGMRSHPLLTVYSNTLSPTTTVDISLIQQGYPINTTPELLTEATIAPTNVSFITTSSDAPIVLPKLDPSDGFPLWVKRTTLAGTVSKAEDGFKLKIQAKIL